MPHFMPPASVGTIVGNGGNDVAIALTSFEGVPQDPVELERILKRAEEGDTSTLPVLKKILDTGHFTESAGNLARLLRETIIKDAGGPNLLLKGAMARKLEQLRNELTNASDTALERLLVDRVVLCWLWLHETEVRYRQFKPGDLSMLQGEHWQRRIDRLQHRYLAAIRALALVRKLAIPVLQVNIARKQVNVASPVPIVQPETTPAHS